MLADSFPRQISARETVRIPIQFDTRGKSGYFSAEVLVHFSNGETRPYGQAFYVISGKLLPIILDSKFAVGEYAPREVELPWSDKDDRIVKLQYDEESCDIQIERRSRTRYYWKFSPREGLPTGRFEIPVLILTDGERSSERRVSISGYNEREVEVQDTELGFGVFAKGESKSVDTILYSPLGKHLTVVSVQVVSGQTVEWDAKNVEPGKVSLRVTMKNDNHAPERVLASKLLVTCEVDGRFHSLRLEAFGLRK